MVEDIDKVLFIGLGGAGQRHLRIFRTLLPKTKFFGFRTTKKTPLLKPDFSVDESTNLEEKYDIELIKEIKEINEIKPKLTVISVPNSKHFDYTKLAFEADSHVFVEKPGCISTEDLISLNKMYLNNNSNLTYKIGYQRKYHPIYLSLKSFLKSDFFGTLLKVEVNVSSFIPDWHPYEDFKKLYACRKELGGGIFTTECHEIDMIIDLFGKPKKSNFNFRNEFKNIDVPDSMKSFFDYEKFFVEFDISFFRKPLERKIKFTFESEILIWDIDKQKLLRANEKGEIMKTYFKNDDMFMLQAIEVLKFSHKETINNLRNLEVYTSFFKK